MLEWLLIFLLNIIALPSVSFVEWCCNIGEPVCLGARWAHAWYVKFFILVQRDVQFSFLLENAVESLLCLTLSRCCIFKAHCSVIYLQSNWGTETTFRGKSYSLEIVFSIDSGKVLVIDCLIFRLMLMLVVLMTLHLLIPISNCALLHVEMIRWLRYWL